MARAVEKKKKKKNTGRGATDTTSCSGYRRTVSNQKPRVRRVPVAMPDGAAAGGWFRSIRFSGFSLIMLVIIVLFVVILAPSLRTLIQQQQQIAPQQNEVDEQKSDVALKKKDVARWNDPAYIEAQARDRLLYVYPGEYSYLVMGDDSASGRRRATTESGTRQLDRPEPEGRLGAA